MSYAQKVQYDDEIRRLDSEIPLTPLPRVAPPHRPPRRWVESSCASASQAAAAAAAKRAAAARAECQQQAAAATTADVRARAAAEAATAAEAEAHAAARAAQEVRSAAVRGERRRPPRATTSGLPTAGWGDHREGRQAQRRPPRPVRADDAAPPSEGSQRMDMPVASAAIPPHTVPATGAIPSQPIPADGAPPLGMGPLQQHVAANDWVSAARVAVALAIQQSLERDPGSGDPPQSGGIRQSLGWDPPQSSGWDRGQLFSCGAGGAGHSDGGKREADRDPQAADRDPRGRDQDTPRSQAGGSGGPRGITPDGIGHDGISRRSHSSLTGSLTGSLSAPDLIGSLPGSSDATDLTPRRLRAMMLMRPSADSEAGFNDRVLIAQVWTEGWVGDQRV